MMISEDILRIISHARSLTGDTCVKHYDDTPVKYTTIFHFCKNDNFQMKNWDIFLIFAQNIYCGYSLEPPQYMF